MGLKYIHIIHIQVKIFQSSSNLLDRARIHSTLNVDMTCEYFQEPSGSDWGSVSIRNIESHDPYIPDLSNIQQLLLTTLFYTNNGKVHNKLE
jgi:hypothetical protein